MSEIRKGALLSYATIVVVNISGLLLTPWIIRALGKEEFGLYVLIGAIAGYLGVMDFGLNNAVNRYVAICAARNEHDREARFLGAALVVNALAALLVLVIAFAVGMNLEVLFGDTLSSADLGRAKIMLALLAINVVLTLSGSLFTAICAGHERFVFPKSVNIARYLMRIVLVLTVLALGGKAIALVLVDTLLALSVFIVTGGYAMRVLRTRFQIAGLNAALVFEVLTYSSWIFLFAMLGQFQWQTGQLVIGAAMNPASVAVYAVGIMLGTYYGAFSSAISSLFISRAAKMTVENADSAGLTEQMTRIGRMSLLVLMLILLGFLSFGRQFIELWVGPDFSEAWLVAVTIMLVYTLPLVQSFANQLLEAKGLFAFKAKTYLFFLPAGVVAGYLLLEQFGIAGMALGIAAGWALALLVMNVYYWRVLNLDILHFFRSLVNGIVPIAVTLVPLAMALNTIPGSGWLNLGMKIAVFTCMYVWLMYRFGMNAAERRDFHYLTEKLAWIRA